MSNKLFCGGLAWATDDEGLRGAFEKFGEVTDATVVLDRETGRSRGFGFVTFANAEDAERARAAMDGAQLDGRTLRVDSAQERQGGRGGPRRDGGGGGGFRGGRGGGGGGGGFRGDRDGGGRGDFGGGGGGGRGDFGGGRGGRGGDFGGGGGRGGDFGGRGRRWED